MEKSIRDLIARLPIPGLKESTDRRVIAEIITKTLKIPVKANQITHKDRIISVSVPPIVKSVIKIKQTELLNILQREDISVDLIR